MPHPLRLEVFEIADIPAGPALMLPDEIEDIRLSAYERGYLAGWQDGTAQVETEAAARQSGIERQIEKLDFTYHEARGHVLAALRPVLEAMVETVLPAAARASVVPVVIEALTPLVQTAAGAPTTLRLPPESRAAFEAATDGLVLPPLVIEETEDLAEGQAEFVLGTCETRIDLTHAATQIACAVRRFYAIQCEETNRA